MNISIDKTKTVPIYIQIKECILNYIKENNLTAGDALPNVKKVASIAGVSTRTADQAFQALIDDSICFRRPKKGTFVADYQRNDLKQICGIISSHSFDNLQQNFLLSELYAGISKAAQKSNTDASMIFGIPEHSIDLYEMSDNMNFQGAVFIEPCSLSKVMKLAKKYPSKTFIVLNYMLSGIEDTPPNVYAVINNDFEGAYRLAEYYISTGLRSAALITSKLGHGDMTYIERQRGFIQAFKDYGIIFNLKKDRLVNEPGNDDVASIFKKSYSKIKKYLAKGNYPEVIFATNDIIAEGVEEYIISEKLDKKVKVAGYDCLIKEITTKHRFNSVKVNYAEMGKVGMQIINSGARNYPKIIKIAPELVIN